jgi:hypothetical protein
MTEDPFLFVGYLVQEPYPVDPRFPAMRLATIDRPIHPALDRILYETIGGVPNVTRFLTALPDASRYPGYVLNGYAIESAKVVPELGLDGVTVYPSKYEYARHWRRPHDGLRVLGYDVVDEAAHPFSVLHYEDYSLGEIEREGGPLNRWALFDSPADAEKFCRYALRENQTDGTVWQVWGA